MTIVLDRVSKAFGEKKVLCELSAAFPAGSITAITGASGCGKTTFLRIVAGLEPPDSGRILGTDGARSAMVFQEDRLVTSISAVANVQLACDLPRKKIKDELAQLELCEEDFRKPVGLLSGGQKRRVALLRALLASSDILLLDEPFTGLDEKTHALARQRVTKLQAGRTLLFVSHDALDAKALCADVFPLMEHSTIKPRF